MGYMNDKEYLEKEEKIDNSTGGIHSESVDLSSCDSIDSVSDCFMRSIKECPQSVSQNDFDLLIEDLNVLSRWFANDVSLQDFVPVVALLIQDMKDHRQSQSDLTQSYKESIAKTKMILAQASVAEYELDLLYLDSQNARHLSGDSGEVKIADEASQRVDKNAQIELLFKEIKILRDECGKHPDNEHRTAIQRKIENVKNTLLQYITGNEQPQPTISINQIRKLTLRCITRIRDELEQSDQTAKDTGSTLRVLLQAAELGHIAKDIIALDYLSNFDIQSPEEHKDIREFFNRLRSNLIGSDDIAQDLEQLVAGTRRRWWNWFFAPFSKTGKFNELCDNVRQGIENKKAQRSGQTLRAWIRRNFRFIFWTASISVAYTSVLLFIAPVVLSLRSIPVVGAYLAPRAALATGSLLIYEQALVVANRVGNIVAEVDNAVDGHASVIQEALDKVAKHGDNRRILSLLMALSGAVDNIDDVTKFKHPDSVHELLKAIHELRLLDVGTLPEGVLQRVWAKKITLINEKVRVVLQHNWGLGRKLWHHVVPPSPLWFERDQLLDLCNEFSFAFDHADQRFVSILYHNRRIILAAVVTVVIIAPLVAVGWIPVMAVVAGVVALVVPFVVAFLIKQIINFVSGVVKWVGDYSHGQRPSPGAGHDASPSVTYSLVGAEPVGMGNVIKDHENVIEDHHSAQLPRISGSLSSHVGNTFLPLRQANAERNLGSHSMGSKLTNVPSSDLMGSKSSDAKPGLSL